MAQALDESDSSDESDEGEFYTEGTDQLLESRRKIARYSLTRWVLVLSLALSLQRWTGTDKRRAQKRIARQRIEVGLPLGKIVNARKELYQELKVSPDVNRR